DGIRDFHVTGVQTCALPIFATGIFLDLLLDAPLGLNALSFILIAFIARFLTRERRILTFGNLWVITALALIAHLMLTFFAQVIEIGRASCRERGEMSGVAAA